MKSCLDLDTLTSIGQALDWDVDQLSHVSECADCRGRLEQLAGIRADLSREQPVRPGFSAGVMAAVEVEAAKGAATMGWAQWLNPVLAAFAAVAVASAARPAPWALLGSAIAASIFVLWRERAGDVESA